LLGTKKLRAFWSPGVTAEMFAKTVPINYKRLRDTCAKLKRYFDRAVEVRITSKLGTDITIGLRGRKAMVDDGNFTKPGKGGNLPCGELFISPELGESHGVIVFDGSISAHEGEIIISEPITMKVMDGFVTAIQGGDEAVKLRATLRKAEKMTRELGRRGKIPTREVTAYLKNIRNLGEFGIGLNDAAEIVGNMLEDEKVYGTCHIALGSNYDDDAKCLLHLDGLIKNPSIYVNNASGTVTEIMIDGKLRKNL
jgi:leucyl aminopeptidase (aminopeptidase T)